MRSDTSPTSPSWLVMEHVRARVETRVAHNSPRLLSGGGYLQQGCLRLQSLGVYCLVSVVSRFWHVFHSQQQEFSTPRELGTSESEGPPFHVVTRAFRLPYMQHTRPSSQPEYLKMRIQNPQTSRSDTENTCEIREYTRRDNGDPPFLIFYTFVLCL